MSEAAADGFEFDPGGRVRPPFVRTDADRERWDLAVNLSIKLWEQQNADAPSGTWMYYTPRSIFFSNIPTGKPPDAG